MTDKQTYFVEVWDDASPSVKGVGEAALFKGLSADDIPDYESRLDYFCAHLNDFVRAANNGYRLTDAVDMSSIRFGLETALSDLNNDGVRKPFTLDDSWRIPINGLVWMGNKDFMIDEAQKKLDQGFGCLKFKIGGIDFEDELSILAAIRNRFPSDLLEIRLDANGGFNSANAMKRIEALARYDIHSLEQPIKPKQWRDMAKICAESPIPIALDEEIIGINTSESKRIMLEEIRPAYVILKPSLCGGFAEADDWISVAEELGICWWTTSALESDIGLNAIARWVSLKNTVMPQGLGTGQLFTNNIPSSLCLDGPILYTNNT